MSEKKILVVDDEPFFVEALTTRLRAAGYSVCSAQNGEEAIVKAKSEKPHLIIMDVMMPQKSGYEAAQKFRDDLETRNIPLIIVSAKAGMKDFFMDMPRVEFIHKPFESKLLMGTIEALIGGAQAAAGQPKCVVLAGVEDLLVSKIRALLVTLHLEVFIALNEANAVQLIKNIRPALVLCQFWEDAQILDPRKIAQALLLQPVISETCLCVYCKEALSVEAMKHFKSERIITYTESSDLLRKVEALIKK